MSNSHELLKTFRVRVGHYEVRVRAHNSEQAIQKARREMARELPRLYDLIRTLTTTRFQVEPII
jgi:hypothetical protein